MHDEEILYEEDEGTNARVSINEAWKKALEHRLFEDDAFDYLISSFENCPYFIECVPPVCLCGSGGGACEPIEYSCRLWKNIQHLITLLIKCSGKADRLLTAALIFQEMRQGWRFSENPGDTKAPKPVS